MTIAFLAYLSACAVLSGLYAVDCWRMNEPWDVRVGSVFVGLLSLVAPTLLALGAAPGAVGGAFLVWTLALLCVALRVQWLRQRRASAS